MQDIALLISMECVRFQVFTQEANASPTVLMPIDEVERIARLCVAEARCDLASVADLINTWCRDHNIRHQASTSLDEIQKCIKALENRMDTLRKDREALVKYVRYTKADKIADYDSDDFIACWDAVRPLLEKNHE